MNPHALKKILQDLYEQKLTPDEVTKKLKTLPYEDLDFARIDPLSGALRLVRTPLTGG